jgi:hypothetical protein
MGAALNALALLAFILSTVFCGGARQDQQGSACH